MEDHFNSFLRFLNSGFFEDFKEFDRLYEVSDSTIIKNFENINQSCFCKPYESFVHFNFLSKSFLIWRQLNFLHGELFKIGLNLFFGLKDSFFVKDFFVLVSEFFKNSLKHLKAMFSYFYIFIFQAFNSIFHQKNVNVISRHFFIFLCQDYTLKLFLLN